MANENSTRTELFKELDVVIEQWKNVPGGLLPIMQHAQEHIGCVDEEVQNYISARTGEPVSKIYGVATFYSLFTLEPNGKHTIGLCLGTACYVRGAQLVLDELAKQLNVEVGKTTSDGLFTLTATRCIGACGLAPAMMIDGEVYGRLVPSKVEGIIKKYRDME